MHQTAGFAIAVARLAVRGLGARGDQPVVRGSQIFAYNGELYNRADLAKALEDEGVRFDPSCDTEVAFRCIVQWGIADAVARFRGMYAFAFYDASTRELCLGRDRLGIKPLYVARLGAEIVFASEIKAILRHPRVKVLPDLRSIATYLAFDLLESPWTPFCGIDEIEPGTLLFWKDGIERVESYFDVVESFSIERWKSNCGHPRERMVQSLADLLASATVSHCEADIPIATLCSGGLDSSMLSALAKQRCPDLAAFVAKVSDAKPESERAKRAADFLGVPLGIVDVDEEAFFGLWPEAVWHADQPLVYPSDIALLAVVRACRREGFRVLLSGEGADELFGGYPWLWQGADLVNQVSEEFSAVPDRWSKLDPAVLSEKVFSRFPPEKAQATLRVGCALDGATRLLRHNRILAHLANVEPSSERIFIAATLNAMYGHLRQLLHRADRMGMAAGVEIRVPYLDEDLVAFGIHAPMAVKRQHHADKWILKQAARSYLPASLVDSPKWGFSTSRETVRRAAGIIRNGAAADLMRWSRKDLDALLRVVGASDALLFGIINLEIWARLYLRGDSTEAIGLDLLQSAS
jgi:asparagine synthase (glutamine-hydrolysing)